MPIEKGVGLNTGITGIRSCLAATGIYLLPVYNFYLYFWGWFILFWRPIKVYESKLKITVCCCWGDS